MGQALDKFRAGEIKAPVFLAITLRLALGKPDLSDVQWTEWQRQAATLKGDPEELAQAIQWAVNDASFWSEVVTDMTVFVRNVDKIVPKYRGAARKASLQAQANQTQYSPSCRALMEKYPSMLRQKIEVEATQDRVAAKVAIFKKSCKACKGKEYVPSKDKDHKGVPVLCTACEAYKRSIWYGIQKEVVNELYA